MGSPPPEGSKNEVLKFRSVKSIVMAPAKTGNDKSSKIVVTKTDQTKRGIRSHTLFVAPKIVVIKLIAPRMEEIPAKWSEKMVKSTEGPL